MAYKKKRCGDCLKLGMHNCFIAYIENHTLCFINRNSEWYCADFERKKIEITEVTNDIK